MNLHVQKRLCHSSELGQKKNVLLCVKLSSDIKNIRLLSLEVNVLQDGLSLRQEFSFSMIIIIRFNGQDKL